jgi:hypothetical protein
MKTKLISLVALLGIFSVIYLAHVRAQKSSAPNASESSKVRFENDRTRVIEYHTNAGKNICGLGMHSHPAHVYIMLTDAKIRVVDTDGKEHIEDARAGEVGWEPAETHQAENIMENNVGCYLIEFKDKDWKPSTGLTP